MKDKRQVIRIILASINLTIYISFKCGIDCFPFLFLGIVFSLIALADN